MKIINAMFSKVNGGLEQSFLNYTPALTMQGYQVIQVIHPESEIKDSCPKGRLVLVHNYNQYDPFAIRKLRNSFSRKNLKPSLPIATGPLIYLKKPKQRSPELPCAMFVLSMTLERMPLLHSQIRCETTSFRPAILNTAYLRSQI